MKLKQIILPAVSAIILSGCAVVEDFQQKVGLSSNKKKVTAVASAPGKNTDNRKPEQPQAQAKTVQTASAKPVAENKQKPAKQKSASKPKPVKQDSKKSGHKTPVTQASYDKINGEWYVMTVLGEKIVADEHPMFFFEGSSRRFYGNNGCNTVNGNFLLGDDSKISLTEVASTMMLCPDAPFEYKINQALKEVAAYSFSNKGADSYMVLKSAKGATLMTLHRSDNAFIDGAWQVMAVNGDRMAVNDDMRLVIDVAEGRVHGNAGCNMVNGTVIVDSEQTSSVQFCSLIATRMACPDLYKETALLLALENVTSWEKQGSDHIVLTDAKGKELVKLRKLSRQELGI